MSNIKLWVFGKDIIIYVFFKQNYIVFIWFSSFSGKSANGSIRQYFCTALHSYLLPAWPQRRLCWLLCNLQKLTDRLKLLQYIWEQNCLKKGIIPVFFISHLLPNAIIHMFGFSMRFPMNNKKISWKQWPHVPPTKWNPKLI